MTKNNNTKYKNYFLPELKPFIEKHSDEIINDEISNDFYEKRRIGENDSFICQMIRKDLIDEFITFVNQTNISINSQINDSYYETNSFLLKNNPTFIEYSVFCGSIQIFKYLFMNQAEMSHSLWLYAIHGSNAEIIQFLEENNIEPDDSSFEECFKESIKCHHNNIASYIDDNHRSTPQKRFDANVNLYSFHYHNYCFFPVDEINDKFNFYYACKYDYFDIFEYFIHENLIDINESIILELFIIYEIKSFYIIGILII